MSRPTLKQTSVKDLFKNNSKTFTGKSKTKVLQTKTPKHSPPPKVEKTLMEKYDDIFEEFKKPRKKSNYKLVETEKKDRRPLRAPIRRRSSPTIISIHGVKKLSDLKRKREITFPQPKTTIKLTQAPPKLWKQKFEACKKNQKYISRLKKIKPIYLCQFDYSKHKFEEKNGMNICRLCNYSTPTYYTGPQEGCSYTYTIQKHCKHEFREETKDNKFICRKILFVEKY